MLNASQAEVQGQPVQLVSLNKTHVPNNVMLFKNSFENCGKRGYLLQRHRISLGCQNDDYH